MANELLALFHYYRSVLQLGSSIKWPEQLEMLTGTREMDVQPLIEYFQPLIEFLEQQLALAGETPGWTADG